MKSKLEEDLARQLDAAGMSYEREFRLLAGRKFRADFKVWRENGPGLVAVYKPSDPLGDYYQSVPDAFRYVRILVEVNGQGPQGRHGGYGHAESDAEKLSAAACLGYRVLTVTGKQVASGQALAWIRCALGLEGTPEDVFSKP